MIFIKVLVNTSTHFVLFTHLLQYYVFKRFKTPKVFHYCGLLFVVQIFIFSHLQGIYKKSKYFIAEKSSNFLNCICIYLYKYAHVHTHTYACMCTNVNRHNMFLFTRQILQCEKNHNTRFYIILCSHRLTDNDMISHDLHVIVTIGPGVFVPEADHMSKLVHDDAKLVTVFAYGYRLRTVATFAHE